VGIDIKDDLVSANGISKKKNELVEEISLLMNGKEKFNEEFQKKFSNRLNELVY
jgi:hypothetical protein